MTSAHPDDPIFLAQLLCTRLCHDLSGPVGALSNGAELIGTDPEMVDAESLGLLADSAAGVAVRLRTLRAAFGRVGALEAADLPGLLTSWAGGRTTVVTPPAAVLAGLSPDTLQLLLNMGLTALDGTLAPTTLVLTVEAEGEAGHRVTADAEGRGPREADGLAAALAGSAGADLGPRTVQAWLTGALARRGGVGVCLEATAAGVRLEAVLPAGGAAAP